MRSDDDFISHLPIPLDGSCNGLQHLAALGRDVAGAIATNVVSELGARRDLYTEVARRVNCRVTEDAGKGNELAQKWLGNVDRKTVKRAVMTTPCGVTDRGMARQLLEEGFVREYAPQVEIPPWTEYVTLGDLQLFPAVMGSRYAFA